MRTPFRLAVIAGLAFALPSVASEPPPDPVPTPAPADKVSATEQPVTDPFETVFQRDIMAGESGLHLTGAGFARLERLAAALLADPAIRLEVAAHTSSEGSHEYNDDYTRRAAEIIVGMLASHGVAADRLVPVGYGERQPAVEDSTSRDNSRIEFVRLPSAPVASEPASEE